MSRRVPCRVVLVVVILVTFWVTLPGGADSRPAYPRDEPEFVSATPPRSAGLSPGPLDDSPQESANSTLQPLGTLLNPDGTLNLETGFVGSLDPVGWRMALDDAGRPRFVRAGPSEEDTAQSGLDAHPEDVHWDTIFSHPGTVGTVKAITIVGQDVYIGGSFPGVGGVTGYWEDAWNIARWDGRRWYDLDSGVSSEVHALAVRGTDLYVGGLFTTVGSGNIPANHIAKWDTSTGEWSALGDGLDNHVLAIALQGNDLYVGGPFRYAGGQEANRVAKWDGSTWSPLGSGVGDYVGINHVNALAADGNDLYVGGLFDTAGGVSVNNIARWDGSAWHDIAGGVTGDSVEVYALAAAGGHVYVGGIFDTAGIVSVSNLAHWDGSTWTDMAGGANDLVEALLIYGDDLYVGGHFTMTGGISITGVAKWDGSAWSALGEGCGNVAGLAVQGDHVYVGGFYQYAEGRYFNHVAQWDGNRWSALGQGINTAGTLRTVALDSQGNVYVGGGFTYAGGIPTNCVARWDGTYWNDLDGGIADYVGGIGVWTIAVDGTDVYVGGNFGQVGGGNGSPIVAANNVARWSEGQGWSALGTGVDGFVYTIAISDSDVYVGGIFDTAGGVEAKRVARWDGSGWSGLGAEIDDQWGGVWALGVTGGKLYAAGNFMLRKDTDGDGQLENVGYNIAVWDGNEWDALSGWGGVSSNGRIWGLAILGSDVYVAGDFTTAHWQVGDDRFTITANNVAKWNGHKWSALGSGLSGLGAPSYATAYAIAPSGQDDLVVGGYFDTAGEISAPYIAKWNGSGWSALGSGISQGPLGATVFALAVDGSTAYLGGDFARAGGHLSYQFAKWICLTISKQVTPSDGGYIRANPDLSCYLEGESVPVQAIPNPGFIFDHWSGDLSGSDPEGTLVLDEDKSVTAHFIDVRPRIVEVDYDYFPGWFMKDVSVQNEIYVTVDWNGDLEGMGEDRAVSVRFELNGARTEVPANGQTTVSIVYDMGYDLQEGKNDLRITAYSIHGLAPLASETTLLQLRQNKVPDWLVLPGVQTIFEVERVRRPGPDLVLYRKTFRFPGAVVLAAVEASRDQAGPTSGRFGPKIRAWELEFTSYSDGRGRVIGYGGVLAEIKGKQFRGRTIGGYTFGGGVNGAVQIVPTDRLRLTELWVFVRGSGTVNSPRWRHPLVPAISLQLVGGLSMEVRLGAAEEEATEEIRFDPNVVLVVEPMVEGIVLAGEKGLAYAEGVLGARARGDFQFFEEPFCRNAWIRTYLRVSAGVLWFEKTQTWTWRWVWIGGGAQGEPLQLEPGVSSAAGGWAVAGRDYLTPGYGTFVGERPASTVGTSPILTDTYPYADPAVAYLGAGQVLALWVHDDPGEEQHQGLELLSSRWDGLSWSPPVSLTDDLIIDFQPALVATTDGALAVWTRFREVITGAVPISPTEIYDQLEIAYASYDAASGTWSAPQRLTDDTLMDFVPGAAGGAGQAMVLWLRDNDNAFPLFPGETTPLAEDLYYAVWDGAGWAISPTLALSDVATAEQPQFAYDGSRAVLVWSGDADGDVNTITDTEIFYTTWEATSTAWTEPQALSSDADADLFPRVVYDSGGVAHLIWVKEIPEPGNDSDDTLSRLYYATLDGGGWTSATLVVEEGGIEGLILVNAQDDLVAVWRAASDDVVDLYESVYDFDDGSWSQPLQLTANRDAEWAYDAVYDDLNDSLFLVLMQREVLSEVVWAEFPSGTLGLEAGASLQPTVTLPITVPVFGASDLVRLVHPLAPDLAISTTDITLTPTNPLPGGAATITATVHNAGDLAADPVKVAFYDGDPDAGGTPIGAVQALTSSLAGGLTATLSVDWSVPVTPAVHTLYVRVDPLDEVVEGDEGNNQAVLGTVLPDLTVAYAYATYPDTQTIALTARVSNVGACPASDVQVEFRQGTITGTLLSQGTLPMIAAGQAEELTVTWDISGIASGTHTIYLPVDPNDGIAEADEGNNVGMMWAGILPDLAISAYDLSIGPYNALSGTLVQLAVHNLGNTDAGTVTLAFYDGDVSGTLLLSTTVAAVPVQGVLTTSAWLSTAGRIYDLYAVIDPDGVVAELDESNNVAVKTVALGEFAVYLPIVFKGYNP